MNEQLFWAIVEKLNVQPTGDVTGKAKELERLLETLSDEDLLRYEEIVVEFRVKAYSRQLCLAVDFISGRHVGHDLFDYAVARLIYLGKKVFYEALAQPDSLASLPGLETAEILNYVPTEVWEDRHPEDDFIPVPIPYRELLEPLDAQQMDELKSRLPQLYPRLYKKYGLPKRTENFFDLIQYSSGHNSDPSSP